MEVGKHDSPLELTPHRDQSDKSTSDLDLRTELGLELRKILIEKRLKQRELASLLAIQQPQVSRILNSRFNHLTIDKLVQLFDRLGWTVKFQIYPQKTS